MRRIKETTPPFSMQQKLNCKKMSLWIACFVVFCEVFCSKFVLGTIPAATSGVPCYLQPAGNACHYELKASSEVCTSASDRKRLMRGITLVNRTLVSLEQQLIRLGISKIYISTFSEKPS